MCVRQRVGDAVFCDVPWNGECACVFVKLGRMHVGKFPAPLAREDCNQDDVGHGIVAFERRGVDRGDIIVSRHMGP